MSGALTDACLRGHCHACDYGDLATQPCMHDCHNVPEPPRPADAVDWARAHGADLDPWQQAVLENTLAAVRSHPWAPHGVELTWREAIAMSREALEAAEVRRRAPDEWPDDYALAVGIEQSLDEIADTARTHRETCVGCRLDDVLRSHLPALGAELTRLLGAPRRPWWDPRGWWSR